MRAAPPSQGPPRDALPAPRDCVHASPDTQASGEFDGERRAFAAPLLPPPRPSRPKTLCQDGTAQHGPLWDERRLVPAFVAQLLGQAMDDPSRPSPRAAYSPIETAPGRLIDRKG